MNKNFMYGVGAVKFKDFVVGYIEENSEAKPRKTTRRTTKKKTAAE